MGKRTVLPVLWTMIRAFGWIKSYRKESVKSVTVHISIRRYFVIISYFEVVFIENIQ